MNSQLEKLQAIDEDARAYRELSSQLKFRQNLVQGLGAAMVFGMFMASGQALFAAAKVASSAGMLAASPWIAGLAGIFAVGIGCLYLASKYYAESVRIDQIHQAKQIAGGMRGMEPTIEQQKPIAFPSHQHAMASPTAPLDKPAIDTTAPQLSVINERALDGRVAASQLERARA